MTNVFRQTRPVKVFTFIAAAPDFRLRQTNGKGDRSLYSDLPSASSKEIKELCRIIGITNRTDLLWLSPMTVPGQYFPTSVRYGRPTA